MAITLVHDCDINRRPTPQAKNGDFRDCDLNEALPTTTHDYTQFNVGSVAAGGKGEVNERRGLLWYDLKAFIPANAVITAAVWWFYVQANGTTDQHLVWLVRIRRNDEGSGNHWKETEATWNNYRSGQAWTTPGAEDITNDRDVGKVVYLGAIVGTGWMSRDILTLVSDAWSVQNGICTFIMARYTYMTENGNISIHAKEYEPYNPYSPHLRITYTLDGRTFQVMVR